MKYRHLGKTGLEVAEICLGTAGFGAEIKVKEAHAIMDAYIGGGGNFVDTADMYSNWHKGNKGGESESYIGEWFKKRKNRRHIVLATKLRCRMWEGPNGEGLGRKHILQACEDSLRRLQTDHIDVYQTHWMEEETPVEETLRALEHLIRQGKVLFAACSNYSGYRLAEACQVAKELGLRGYVSLQPYYNMIDRKDFESDMLPAVIQYGLGVIPYSPLAEGFLTGKYRKGKPIPKSPRAKDIQKNKFSERNFKIIDAVEEIARKRGKTCGQVSLAWLLAHDWMSAPIIGASGVAQVKENLGAAGWTLSVEEKKTLDEASAWEEKES
jgi:aryl-alcohol dehydrogenase-like predicted oxidoreductase